MILVFVAEKKTTKGLKRVFDIVNVVKSVAKNDKIQIWMKWGVLKQIGI